jgi:hypothetical protein
MMLLVLAPWLVVPGQSLGRVQIGANPEKALATLGRPTYGDAAMGKSWSTWVGKGGGRLDVYTVRDATGTSRERVTVHLARATSASFHLANGFKPGSSIKSLQRAYPAAKVTGSYKAPSGTIRLWDDVQRGLAWEAAPNGRVLALIAHRKGEPVTASLGPYLSSPLQRG